MEPVKCRHCSARVLVRKSSPAQTSVQWNTTATATCMEFAGRASAHIPHCGALRASIDLAVRDGQVEVPDS